MKSQNKPKGKLGEDIVTTFLTQKGYRIIARNFKARYGEIDIIALYQGILIVIEVKTRWSTEFGTPQEAVTPRKLREVIKTAEYFILLHPELPKAWQIDVVAVSLNYQTRKAHIEHLENVTS